MVHMEVETFYLISLANIEEEFSNRYKNCPLIITREEILMTLSMYSLTRYFQNVRMMQIYNVSGDLVCQEVVLHFTTYSEAEAVVNRIISTLLKEAESLPAFATLSPVEKLWSAILDRYDLSLFTGRGSHETFMLVAEKCYAIQRGELQEITLFEGVEAYSALADSYEEIAYGELLAL
jgi:hypothetical protein